MRRARTVGRWFVLATLGLLLLGLVLSGAACPGRTTQPTPTRLTRPAPRRVVRPAPVTPAADLGAAITRTRTEVDRRDWAAADRAAATIGSAWQPIRTRKTWPASDIATFQAAYTRLRTAIKAKDKPVADRALADMTRLERKNVGARPRPAPTRAMRPTVPRAPGR